MELRLFWVAIPTLLALVDGSPDPLERCIYLLRIGGDLVFGSTFLTLRQSESSNGSGFGSLDDPTHRTNVGLQFRKLELGLLFSLPREIHLPSLDVGRIFLAFFFQCEGLSKRGSLLQFLHQRSRIEHEWHLLIWSGLSLDATIILSSRGRVNEKLTVMTLPFQEAHDPGDAMAVLLKNPLKFLLRQLPLGYHRKIVGSVVASVKVVLQGREPSR